MSRKDCKLIGTLRDVKKKGCKFIYLSRYHARCREKGCKSIGTMRDVEKRGVNL